jgi:hypothetical protein
MEFIVAFPMIASDKHKTYVFNRKEEFLKIPLQKYYGKKRLSKCNVLAII